MIEDIFLTYANNPLKGRPEKLYEIFNVVGENLPISLLGITPVIERICTFSTYSRPIGLVAEFFPEDYVFDFDRVPLVNALPLVAIVGERLSDPRAREIIREICVAGNQNLNREMELLIKESWGFRCYFAGEMKCETSMLVTCYECYQNKFLSILQRILGGKEFSEIEGFRGLCSHAQDISESKTEFTIERQNTRRPFRERLKGRPVCTISFHIYVDWSPAYHKFNDFLWSIVGYSLLEFLLKNDRRKIKRCQYCNRFFIAKDIKRKSRCYLPNCQKAYNRDKKRRQRENDPARYYTK